MPLGAFRLNGIAKYFAPAGPATEGFILELNDIGNYSNYTGVKIDSTGNIYTNFTNTGAVSNSYYSSIVMKTDSVGDIQWIKGYGHTNPSTHRASGFTVLDNDNIAISLYSGNVLRHMVLNPSGNILYKDSLFVGTTMTGWGHMKIGSDSYAVGYESNQAVVPISKINSTGTRSIFKYKSLRSSSPLNLDGGIANDNWFLVQGYINNSSYDSHTTALKWSGSGWTGRKTWQTTSGAKGIVGDSSDNVYVSQADRTIKKINPSGTVLWNVKLNLGGIKEGLATDGENLYVMMEANSKTYIVALSCSTGNIIWQNELSEDSSKAILSEPRTFQVTDTQIYFVAKNDTNNKLLVCKFPKDGTLTGDYGPYNWTTSTLFSLATPVTFTYTSGGLNTSPATVDSDPSEGNVLTNTSISRTKY